MVWGVWGLLNGAAAVQSRQRGTGSRYQHGGTEVDLSEETAEKSGIYSTHMIEMYQ
jgi:hypothetical protein